MSETLAMHSMDKGRAVEHRALDLSPLLDHLRGLRALLAVLAHGTTVAAAESVHVSQPAITRAIAKLEAACGGALFERTARGMQATREGQLVGARAEEFFTLLQQGVREALAIELAGRAATASAKRVADRVSASQLRALLAVAVFGSEVRASAHLGVSQPAVNASLQDLERLIGVPLFYKRVTGTRLTPPGEAVLLRTKQAMAELRGMDSDLASWHGHSRGDLVIGVLPLSVPIFLPEVLRAFAAQHAGVPVRLVDGTYEALVNSLLGADIDAIAGALRAETPSAEVQQQPLFDDDLVVIARHDHPCLHQPALTLRDLLDWPWVTPLSATPAERVLHRAFAAQGLPPPAALLSASSPVMTHALVVQSGLLAIASRGQALLDDHGGQVSVVPVKLTSTTRHIGIATRSTGLPSSHLLAFVQLCGACAGAGHDLP